MLYPLLTDKNYHHDELNESCQIIKTTKEFDMFI